MSGDAPEDESSKPGDSEQFEFKPGEPITFDDIVKAAAQANTTRVEVDPQQFRELISGQAPTRAEAEPREQEPSPEEIKARADASRHKTKAMSDQADVILRIVVALVILTFMGWQLATANDIFREYGRENQWNLAPAAIHVWMTATVVEVIGVVYVIANYLFPKPDGDEDQPQESDA